MHIYANDIAFQNAQIGQISKGNRSQIQSTAGVNFQAPNRLTLVLHS